MRSEMKAAKRRGARLGPAEWVPFTQSNGLQVKRLMRPELDEHGGWVRWIPCDDYRHQVGW